MGTNKSGQGEKAEPPSELLERVIEKGLYKERAGVAARQLNPDNLRTLRAQVEEISSEAGRQTATPAASVIKKLSSVAEPVERAEDAHLGVVARLISALSSKAVPGGRG